MPPRASLLGRRNSLDSSGRDYEDLPSVMEIPLGKIVCIANLVDCQRTENVRGKLSTL